MAGGAAETPGAARVLAVRSAADLPAIVASVRERSCDFRYVAFDHDRGELHLPVADAGSGPPPTAARASAHLIVRRIVEFAMEGTAGVRRFSVDGLAYDEATRALTLRTGGPLAFLLTVDDLDVALKTTGPRAQDRPPR